MKKNLLIWPLTALTLILCACGSTTDTPRQTDTKTESSAESVSVIFETQTKEYKADDGTVLVTDSRQIPIVTITGSEAIAAKINDDMNGYLSAFSGESIFEWAKSDYEASLEEDGYHFPYTNDITVALSHTSDSVLSFGITYYSYTGGAHGNYGTIGRSYSLKTGEQISFNELSDDMDAFRQQISDYLFSLASTPEYQERMFPLDEITGKEDLETVLFAPDNWLFDDDGITFISNPYELGAYAEGTILFTIPYEEAVPMGLKTDFH